MSSQLISMPSCDNNISTISEWPLNAAKIKGVLLDVHVKFH